MAPSATEDYPDEPAWIDGDALRTEFTLAMSAMYKAEVHLYGDLVRIVSHVNSQSLRTSLDPKVREMRYGDAQSPRLDIERHGAIRLGTAHELRTIRRMFALIGLHPVGYYDLSEAGLPMHATCFRPKDRASLRQNPFRVFTSVLRPELIRDERARELALGLLSKRNIFSYDLLRLLDAGDTQGGKLTREQGRRFVAETMRTFGWHETAAATLDEYRCLKAEHPILADIACFRSSHINHLTPRTLDIVGAQEQMKAEGLCVKDRIEGPPARSCPILLRQTSFLAVEEAIRFVPPEGGSPVVSGSHRARFGEIEERGAAVTPAGRRLYDELLHKAMAAAQTGEATMSPEDFDQLVADGFEEFPDDWDALREHGLIYSTYQVTDEGRGSRADTQRQPHRVGQLLAAGLIEALPITYEDFLPLSAAGIFQSNLGSESSSKVQASPDIEGMEEALGTRLADSDALYKQMQAESIERCAAELGIAIEL